MTKKEDMLALQNDPQIHYNCAQSVLIPFAEDLGITREQAAALTRNFGGGMGCGSVCGALTGALMALGYLESSLQKRDELMRRFQAENGAVNCADLLKAAAGRGESKKVCCNRMVAQCLDFVCETLAEASQETGKDG